MPVSVRGKKNASITRTHNYRGFIILRVGYVCSGVDRNFSFFENSEIDITLYGFILFRVLWYYCLFLLFPTFKHFLSVPRVTCNSRLRVHNSDTIVIIICRRVVVLDSRNVFNTLVLSSSTTVILVLIKKKKPDAVLGKSPGKS